MDASTANRCEIDGLVRHFFGQATASRESYRPAGNKTLEEVRTEVIEGVFYRYDLVDGSRRGVILQIYCGLSRIGGHFWEQEVRVLLRAASLRHPALPVISSGGYEEPEVTKAVAPSIDGFAYVVTRKANHTLALPALKQELRQQPVTAVRQFYMLADGLAHLHNLGIAHRNLWAGTVDADIDPELAIPQFRLSRFEMSRMVADLLRATVGDPQEIEQRTKRIISSQDLRALPYYPQERLRFLFAGKDEPGAHLGDLRSDVFALGILVCEWFLDDLPVVDVDISRLSDPKAGEDVIKAVLKVQEELRDRLLNRRDLPKVMHGSLRELLLGMIDPYPHLRPGAKDVVTKLNECFEELTSALEGTRASKPYLVAFVPHEYRGPLWEKGWLNGDPNSAEGRERLAAFIEEDLRGATLLHAPHGAEPYIRSGDPKSKRESRQLLKGRTHAWFCRPFRPRSPLGSALGSPVDDVVLITFVVPLESLRGQSVGRAAARAQADRVIPQVQAIAYDIASDELSELRHDRPKWAPLIEALTPPLGSTPEELAFEQALDWLLTYQGIELRAREYPYVMVEQTGRIATLRLDRARDDHRKHADGMTRRFYNQSRDSFGEFFANLVDDDGWNEIEVLGDSNGRPDYRSRRGKVSVDEHLGDDAVKVKQLTQNATLPAQGWLRPSGDGGSHIALQRQADARWELLSNKVLLGQLRRPSTIRGLPGRWKDVIGDSSSADVILDLLVSEPFSALQGPPGTGKTEVAAQALTAFLKVEQGARVLVSAQSNYALDNLALRLLQRMGALDARYNATARTDQAVALRVTTNAGEARVHPSMEPFTIGRLTDRLRQSVYRHASKEHKNETDKEVRRFLKERWLPIVEDCRPELADRLLRGASIVFATCAAAVPQFVSSDQSSAVFDWVLIEEAAKAWPTELAIPLARGLRWTLIGDHRQLPAHRRREVLRFLHDSNPDGDDDVGVHGTRGEEYEKVLNLFGSLFDATAEKQDDGAAGLHHPIQRLTRQFRMNEPIKEIVSRVFYPRNESREADGLREGLLQTGKEHEPHGLRAPGWLGDHSVVWVDTNVLPQCADELAWANRGEVDMVADLVAQMRPAPTPGRHGLSEEPLAILTPYRRQAELLRARGHLSKHVSTIHSFQGKEADIVIVSLVRDTRRGDGEHPWRNIGHLDQQELVNVMFSRARRLLVIVGDFPHFQKCGSAFWHEVCVGVERFGIVVPGTEVMAP